MRHSARSTRLLTHWQRLSRLVAGLASVLASPPAGAQTVTPKEIVGVYYMASDSVRDGYVSGNVAIVEDGPAFRIVGWMTMRGQPSGVKPVSDRVNEPLTRLRDGTFAADIGGHLRGGFKNDTLLVLSSTGDSAKRYLALGRVDHNEDFVFQPDGLYPVRGATGIYGVSGIVAVLGARLPFGPEKSSVGAAFVYVDLRGTDSAERITFFAPATIRSDGAISVASTKVNGLDTSARGTVKAGQLSLEVYRQINKDHYLATTVRGVK